MADLLLHSMSEFRELIFSLVAESEPAHLVEIGSESGRFTEELTHWALGRRARLTTIDPSPGPTVRSLGEAHPEAITVVASRSIPALETVDAADFYLVDGDHNYYTVTTELRLIQEKASCAGIQPIIVLHDVCWPWARRDLYYDPNSIPPDHVHPHTFDRGVLLDVAGVVEGGFRGCGQFACAQQEGGPKNGVLAAVDDFLDLHPEFDFTRVSAIFGLGILIPKTHTKYPSIRALVCLYSENPLLARLEENRLRLYLQLVALQDREMEILAARDALLKDRDSLAQRLDQALRERDGAVRDVETRAQQEAEAVSRAEAMTAERNALASVAQALTLERDGLLAKTPTLAAEPDALTRDDPALACERDSAKEPRGPVTVRLGTWVKNVWRVLTHRPKRSPASRR